MTHNHILAVIKKNLPLIIAMSFWLILSVVMVGFVNDIFRNNEQSVLQKEKIMLLLFMVFSAILAIFIVVYLIRQFILYLRHTFGQMLKFKITVFFIFVILLSMLPTVIIGVRFIQASMNVWFSNNIGKTFDLSRELLTSFYAEKKYDLSDEFNRIDDFLTDNSLTAGDLADRLPALTDRIHAECLGLFDADSRIITAAGADLWNVPLGSDRNTLPDSPFILQNNQDGIFMQRHYADDRLYLVLPIKILNFQGELLGFINIANEIHADFDEAMSEMDSSLRNWTTVSLYRQFFVMGFAILFVGLLFPIILVVLLISIILSEQLLKPIADLSVATKQVADDNYQIIPSESYSDEYIILADSFNAMIREIENSRQKLSQNEKILAWKDIARRFAHEIRNPLSSVRLSIERLIRKHDGHSDDFDMIFDKCTSVIIREVERMDRQLQDFSNLAKTDGGIDLTVGGVKAILSDAAELFAVNKNNVVIELTPDIDDCIVKRDENLLKSVFNNLILNAIEASSTGQRVRIDMTAVEIGFTKYARISVQDWGCGVKSNVAGVTNPDIFEPYWTTKSDGQGLGLAMCQRIVHQHNGRIYYQSSEDENDHGTIFFVEIPMAE